MPGLLKTVERGCGGGGDCENDAEALSTLSALLTVVAGLAGAKERSSKFAVVTVLPVSIASSVSGLLSKSGVARFVRMPGMEGDHQEVV